MIGRITAPIMWFFIVDGFHYTRNFNKYAFRLFVFAFISHFAYNFSFGIPFISFRTTAFNQTSVIWALAWGLVALKVDTSQNPKFKKWHKNIVLVLIYVITFCADWSSIAVVAILQMGRQMGNLKKQMAGMVMAVSMYSVIYILFVNPVYGLVQMFVILSIPLLKRYRVEQGEWRGMKWFFYLYYPLHLVFVGILRVCLYGNIGVMIIVSIIPYTWVNGGRTATLAEAINISFSSIVITALNILIALIASQIIPVKFNKFWGIVLFAFLIVTLPMSFMGLCTCWNVRF